MNHILKSEDRKKILQVIETDNGDVTSLMLYAWFTH